MTLAPNSPKFTLLQPPVGVSSHIFRTVLAGASAAYTVHRGVPTVEQIKVFCTCTLKTISKVIGTPEFKEVMNQRGFAWDNVKLTPEQYFAVSIITNPTNRKGLNDKLKQAGVKYATYRAWLKQPHFRDYISKVSEDMLGEHVQDVHTRVVERATNGDMAAIKLYYELTGRHDPQRQQMVDLQGIIGLILEVISRHVPNTQTLGLVTKDIDLILSGGVPRALEQFDVSRIAGGDLIEDAVIVEDTELTPVGEAIGDIFDFLKEDK